MLARVEYASHKAGIYEDLGMTTDLGAYLGEISFETTGGEGSLVQNKCLQGIVCRRCKNGGAVTRPIRALASLGVSKVIMQYD